MKKFGVSHYEAVYEDLFIQNLKRYSLLKKPAKKRIDRILKDPYHNTEFLGDPAENLI